MHYEMKKEQKERLAMAITLAIVLNKIKKGESFYYSSEGSF